MTSRTPMGIPPPRPPQRTLSNSSLTTQQRLVSQQRALPQHQLPASPATKESFGDTSGEAPEGAQSRPGINTPRRGGSRLRLELSNDVGNGGQLAVESPQSLPSARGLQIGEGFDGANSPALSRVSNQENDNPPMPMPKRKHFTSKSAAPRDANTLPATSAKKDGRPKPYTVEAPSDAPRLPGPSKSDPASGDSFGKGLFSGRADFFPWTGKHLEDEWSNESAAKGIWEKYSTTESASARMAISPALKQKSGLTALSHLFIGVLNQRRQRGHIKAPSSFKPPPRVTLTDTKREVWLRDLANPATSLRRLSRTIPHGVRGRALLDQCLNKNVPIERAVWLAKCVGANEIRAFKRKGANATFVMGGEIKWCRDWTVFVEQFVDAVVSSVEESDWKSRVTYAIRLATSLYSEHLLDRDHYLDWVMSGFDGSNQARLPMWLLIARIYWVDLLRFRKYGRQLVAALLRHMHTIYDDPDRDIMAPLAHQLSFLLRDLVKSSPDNFVQPESWDQHRDLLNSLCSTGDGSLSKCFSSINNRNRRLTTPSSSYPTAGRQRLTRLLDSTLRNLPDPELASKCWATSDDKEQLVRTVLEWATSIYRPGISKIYLATKLLSLFKTWQSESNMASFDATTPLLEIIDAARSDQFDRKQLLYAFVAELIREKIFSMAHYLQWLIARGGIQDSSELDPEQGPCASRLLVEIPLEPLVPRMRTERANLLRRAADYSIADEEANISTAVKCVRQSLGYPVLGSDPLSEALAQRKPLPLRKLISRIRNSSRALKYAVSAELRDITTNHWSSGSSHPATAALFNSMRTILEAIEDYAVLGDVVRACLKALDADLLAACTDTISVNLSVFLASNFAQEAFLALMERLQLLRQQGAIARPFLSALADLARRMPDRAETARQLHRELLHNDRSNAIDACSPVSDNMMAQAGTGEGELSDEVDRLLASGNTIDHPTMNRLFRTIIPRLEAGWGKGDETVKTFGTLLTKMRVFDMQHFDKLTADWLSHIRTLDKRPALSDMLPLLITLGCLNISSVLEAANASPVTTGFSKKEDHVLASSATYLQELLQMLLVRLPKSSMLSCEEAYRFRIHQEAAKSDHTTAFLGLIGNAVAEYAAVRNQRAEIALPLDDKALGGSLLETLRFLVVVDSSAVRETLNIRSLPQEAVGLVARLTTKLLLPDEADSTMVSFDHILALATELTLPFCQLKLEFDLSVSESNPTAAAESPVSRFNLFANAMDRAIEANNIAWTSMLPCLSSDISQHLKSLAHNRLLDLMPSAKNLQLSDVTSEDQIHLAENLLGVIEAISAGQPSSKPSQLSQGVVDKFCDLCEILANKDAEMHDARAAILKDWLPAMLRLVMLYSTKAESAMNPPASLGSSGGKPPTTAQDCRTRLTVALCSLLLELDHRSLSNTGALSQEVFDVALPIVDSLTDDLRHQAAKAILLLPGQSPRKHLSSDARLYYLLSTPPPTAADSLVMVQRTPNFKRDMTSIGGTKIMGALYGLGQPIQEKSTPFVLRRWEMLSESTPNVGENDTSLSLGLFEAIKIQ